MGIIPTPVTDIFQEKPEQPRESPPMDGENIKEEIKDLLIEADRLKYSIGYSIEEKIIGKCNNSEVFKISGNCTDTQSIIKVFDPFFTPEMAEFELYKINLCPIGNEVGALLEETHTITVTDRSEFTFLEQKPNLIRVQVHSPDVTGNPDMIEYTLEKDQNGPWIITGSSAESGGKKIKYITDWHFEASSVFSEIVGGQNVTYHPANAFDFKRETAWVEGNPGDGIGEWIAAQSEQEQFLSGIELVNGFAKSKETYYNNNRVKRILIEFSDGTEITENLEDDLLELQSIDFGHEVKTTSLKTTIMEVYPGNKYRDTCISEIRFFIRL